ncbi:DUF948 domain-containing protein [Aerococcaceae bacterium zg-B36]|uniref:DUF948 domain-containing protein n=1 Tax=Aerococcaceae bacterium zg-252 TaxID=2796928 RepID=UPI001BD865C0|nr:DUF948 domain-containing protein [Aerococcaceae bacterium zg-B36]
MTLGGVAALIAAIAFAALVVVVCISLGKLPKLLSDLQLTIQRVNTTIDVVTKDVDSLSIEVEALLNKTNSLMDDVNGKLAKTDPLFGAIGELGETVSEINVSAKDTATNLISGIGKRRPSRVQRLFKTTRNLSKAKDFVTASPNLDEVAEPEVETVVTATDPMSELERELYALAERETSKTAGEITINR